MFITLEAFHDTYRPIKNHLDDGAAFEGCMFETYGFELAEVLAQPPDRVWTIIGESDLEIVSGFHVVNRIGYLITDNPAQGRDTIVIRLND